MRAVDTDTHLVASFDADELVRRILVPVGWAACPSFALRFAEQIAARTGAQLRLVHVRIWDPPLRGEPRFYLETEREALSKLERSLDQAWAAGLRASGIVANAERHRVARAVAAEAASWNADFIVMAKRRRSRLGRWLWKPLSDQVARCTPCPVMIVYDGQGPDGAFDPELLP